MEVSVTWGQMSFQMCSYRLWTWKWARSGWFTCSKLKWLVFMSEDHPSIELKLKWPWAPNCPGWIKSGISLHLFEIVKINHHDISYGPSIPLNMCWVLTVGEATCLLCHLWSGDFLKILFKMNACPSDASSLIRGRDTNICNMESILDEQSNHCFKWE